MNKEAINAICNRAIELAHHDRPKRNVLEMYWSDILHDILTLNRTDAPTSFLWCVRTHGTHLFALPLPSKENDQYNFRGALRFIVNSSFGSECYIWYRFTAEHGLQEIELSRVRDMVEERKL